MRKGVKLAAALALLWLAAPAPAQDRAAASVRPRPAIWLLADADTKIFLFGTYHILPRDFRWRSPLFDDIARRADELVVEVSDRDARETLVAMGAAMRLGKQAPIVWRVSRDRRPALAEMVAGLGVPIERFDGLQTWGVALALAAAQIVQTVGGGGSEADGGEDSGEEGQRGAPPTLADLPGVEDALEAEFRAARRPISGIETAAEQMSFFASLSFADQRRFLEAMIDEYRHGKGGPHGPAGPASIGEDEWARGNVEAIALETGAMPEPLYDALIRRRNAAWTGWLAARLERPGTLLFAVGAGHLAGPDSVQAMLAARGIMVRRIQ